MGHKTETRCNGTFSVPSLVSAVPNRSEKQVLGLKNSGRYSRRWLHLYLIFPRSDYQTFLKFTMIWLPLLVNSFIVLYERTYTRSYMAPYNFIIIIIIIIM